MLSDRIRGEGRYRHNHEVLKLILSGSKNAIINNLSIFFKFLINRIISLEIICRVSFNSSCPNNNKDKLDANAQLISAKIYLH